MKQKVRVLNGNLGQKALADANARLTELLFEQDQVGVIIQMNSYRNAIAKANDTSVSVPGPSSPPSIYEQHRLI